MSTQPEQVLEGQLVAQLQTLGYVRLNQCFLLWITLWKSIAYSKEFTTFASTVPVLLPVRSACGSFFVHSALKKYTSPAYQRSTLEGSFLFNLLCHA
jgi:hypothetical protein